MWNLEKQLNQIRINNVEKVYIIKIINPLEAIIDTGEFIIGLKEFGYSYGHYFAERGIVLAILFYYEACKIP